MITFKDFLNETVISTKRKNMIHLQNMRDLDFIRFIQELKSKSNAKLQGINVSLKVDGGGARFGISDTGKPFFEGSRTGPIFEPKAFSNFAKNKDSSQEIIARSYHYDDMWEIITQSDFIKILPKDSKVVCEIFYNPMGKIEDSGITFVSIKYDRKKVGSLLTIVPFEVIFASTGEKHPESEKIIEKLINKSTDEIKIISPKLKFKGSIDLSGMIDPILSLSQESIDLLSSRKPSDTPMKKVIRSIIQGVKDQISSKILDDSAIVGKDLMGPEIEGLVLDINGQMIKVTTPEFKITKRK